MTTSEKTKAKTKSKLKKKQPKAAKRGVASSNVHSITNGTFNDPWALTPKQLKAEEKLKKVQIKNAQIIAARKEAFHKLTLENLLSQVVNKPIEFFYCIEELKLRSALPLKVQLGERWYPTPILECYTRTTFLGEVCQFHLSLKFYDINWPLRILVDASDFLSKDGTSVQKTFNEIINELGLMISSSADLVENANLVQLSQSFNKKPGSVLDGTGPVLITSKSWFGPPIISIPYASAKYPRMVIVEPDLEMGSNDRDYDYGDSEDLDLSLPIVRAFSLDLKQYVYVDVRDLKEHVFQENSIEKLVLPKDLKDIVTSVFDAKDVFGDLFNNRHGGMVIMANGPPGVGKTLSSEVFAEKSKRPLYVLEMGELGVNLQQVETSLNVIFTRAARWNTVLLFDEVDIFFSKRTEHDLERNAIVGVFLRLLDQYKGLLFLTTNRAEVIDPAFTSRITLRLDYPALTTEIRSKIWNHMLDAADLKVDGDMKPIVEYELNGRQVRNVVRLLKAITTDKVIKPEVIEKYLKYSPVTN